MILVLGLLAGLHAASWGAYKDIPYEGFHTLSYLRSIALAVLTAVSLSFTPLGREASPVVLIGTVYALERLATEWWKSILREEDQSAYSIPMRFAVHGRPVDGRAVRYAIGVLVLAVGSLLAIMVDTLQHHVGHVPTWVAITSAGGIGGWATAVGGAWKDAPVEGFSGLKFLRSPAVATAWAAPLSLLTTSWVVLAVAAGGFAVATIETYKAFLTAGRPPGKFATRPVLHPHLAAVRYLFVVVHVLLWTAFAVTLAVGVLPATRPPWLPALGIGLPDAIDVALAASAAAFAALVAVQNLRSVPAGTQR